MKRLFCLIICAVMLAALCGCTTQKQEFIDPVEFYYLLIQPENHIYHGSSDSIIAPEQREGYQIRNRMNTLIEVYLNGPATESFQSPFPANTRLITLDTNDKILTVILSDEIAELSGVDLVLACACLSRTFMELWNFETINIQAENEMLDGKPVITFDKSNFFLTDDTVTHLQPEN